MARQWLALAALPAQKQWERKNGAASGAAVVFRHSDCMRARANELGMQRASKAGRRGGSSAGHVVTDVEPLHEMPPGFTINTVTGVHGWRCCEPQNLSEIERLGGPLQMNLQYPVRPSPSR